MEEKLYKLTDLETEYGFNSATLRKRISRGELSAVVRYERNKPKNFLTQATLEMLLAEREQKGDQYQEMVAYYLSEMRSPVSDLFENRSLSDKHVSEMERYLKLFWETLGQKATVTDFSATSFKAVMLNFAHKYGNDAR